MRSLVLLAITALAAPSVTAQLRDCRPAQTPHELPAASALVDSAHAIADLAPFSRAGRPMLFSLIYNEDDSLPHVRPLDKADAIAAVLVMRALRPQPPSEIWAIRVRVQEGQNPMLTLERSTYCPPVPDSTPMVIVPNVTSFDLQHRDRVPIENLRIDELEMLVSAEGEVLVVHLIGSTGVKAFDDQLTRDLKHRRFHPALLDDLPMQAVYRTGGKSPRL